MPASRPPLVIQPLQTERLDLAPLDPAADAPALHAMLSDPIVHRYDIDAAGSQSVAETELRLRRQVVANDGATWAIALRGGSAIGTIGIVADQDSTIRGIGWSLTPSYWGEGFMSEAARSAVPYLLAQDGVDGLEAWVDSRNLASVGVARAAGMTERSRLPRVYADHVAQTLVMARAAVRADPEVFGTFSTLQVTDVARTLTLLQSILRLYVAWAVPDPPDLAFMALEPWSASPGFQLAQTSSPIVAGELSFDVGIPVDVIRERVAAAGLAVVAEPADRPWFRRDMTFRLPDGHLISISGPSSPSQA